MEHDNFRKSESESDRESEVQPRSSANRQLSMELMGEGARVTSLTLAGGKLLVTIEAALESSKLTTAVVAVSPSKPDAGVIPFSETKPDSDAAKPPPKGTIVAVKPPISSSFEGGRRKKESGRFFLEKNDPPLPPALSIVPDPAAEPGDAPGAHQANGESAVGTVPEDTPFMVEDPGVEGPDASGQSGLVSPSLSVAGAQVEKSAPVATPLSLKERVPETIRLAGEPDSGSASVLEETKAKIEVKAPSPETGPSDAGATISLAPPLPPADGGAGMFEPRAGGRMIQDAPLPETPSPETGSSDAGATISLAPPLPPADGVAGMFEPQAEDRMIQDAPLPEMREPPKPGIEPAAESVPPMEPSIFQDEGSVIGGERHGEPRPSLSDWSAGVFSGKPAPASSESPFLSGAAVTPSFQPEVKAKTPEKAPPAPPPVEKAPPAPEQRKPEGDARKESGATTILIRYTCPRCKTQGMQAVDKVGTVVTCSNCGKAMRLVMKK